MAKEFGHGEGCRRQKTSLIWFESGGEKSEQELNRCSSISTSSLPPPHVSQMVKVLKLFVFLACVAHVPGGQFLGSG